MSKTHFIVHNAEIYAVPDSFVLVTDENVFFGMLLEVCVSPSSRFDDYMGAMQLLSRILKGQKMLVDSQVAQLMGSVTDVSFREIPQV
ncbi:hypothetical protein FDI24_gp178 [Acidovorax phage ACP17]|uniref:Uncharacterized protein n=1 Tax=Acidovorax phage ACP17 TaxID=2010329 RepID=A0A218M334_9CAUD|nr:hypothetical protein FDI24_gp178 [Acidovorax phage ACP17]ASD50460.1 hypothetical protein [Acidovorax phage ACP17]